MDMVDLLKMGAQVFINSKQSGDAGSGLDIGNLTSALSGLSEGRRGSGFDMGSLIAKMDTGGLGSLAESWLSDGDNETISPNQITDMFGAGKVSDFASSLGLSKEEAAGGLSEALPQIVDKASSGGSLLGSIGGISGAVGLASKLFR